MRAVLILPNLVLPNLVLPSLVLAILALACPAQAQTVIFDAFLTRAEKCEFGEAFGNLQQDIVAKYGNDFGTKTARVDPKVTLRIPPEIAAGVGAVRSVNKGEYTQVIVPLRGTWRGVALAELEAGMGNENGINVWVFRFAAPRDQVVRAFGAGVAATAKEFKSHPSEAGPFTITIPKGKAEIVCDQST